MEWFQDNWQFLIGDIIIPLITFIAGLFIGKTVERKKASSHIKGNDNTVIQNTNLSDK